jgi:hypothetical protein
VADAPVTFTKAITKLGNVTLALFCPLTLDHRLKTKSYPLTLAAWQGLWICLYRQPRSD